MVRCSLLALALLTPTLALAQDEDALEGVAPTEVYRLLLGQSEAPPDTPETLNAVLERTGHSRQSAARLLQLQQREARCEQLSWSWLDDDYLAKTHASREAARAARAAELPPAPRELYAAASWLREAYRAEALDGAQRLVAEHPDLLLPHEALAAEVSLDARYEGGDLLVTASRLGAPGRPLAIVIPPGTVGECLRVSMGKRYDEAQPLALLEPRVIELTSDAIQASARIPVACAGYGIRGPRRDQPYRLEPAQGPTAALLRRVCAGQDDAAAVQLAVWAVDDGISSVRWSDTRTFRGDPVQPPHGAAAARLIAEAGLDPRALELFADAPGTQP